MNLNSKCVVTIIVTILACGLSVSCSSDDPQNVMPESFKKVEENPLRAPNLPDKDNFDAGYFRSFFTKGETVTLERNSVSMYINDGENGWVTMDMSEYLGFGPSIPDKLVFRDASLYRDVLGKSPFGPHPLYLVWKKYCLDNGENIEVWYKCPTEIDVDKGVLKFALSRKLLATNPMQLNFTSFSSNSICGYSISRLVNADSSSLMFMMEMVSMKPGKGMPLGDNTHKAFGSEREACKYMLAELRAKYGRYVDVTEVHPAENALSVIEDLEEVAKRVDDRLSDE